jgi:hypothetical protein
LISALTESSVGMYGTQNTLMTVTAEDVRPFY